MGRRRLGVGWPAGGCVVRRNRRSSPYYRAAADLYCTATDRPRPSGNRSAADRGCTSSGSASGSSASVAAHRATARRGPSAADRGAAATADRGSSSGAARYLRAARLCAFHRSSRFNLRDDRTRLVAWRLHYRRFCCRRRDGGYRPFRPSRICRRTYRLSWPTVGTLPLGLGWWLAPRMGWRLAWRRSGLGAGTAVAAGTRRGWAAAGSAAVTVIGAEECSYV